MIDTWDTPTGPSSNNHRVPGETERAGFEPAMEFDPHTRLAGECLQPLGHLSWDRQGPSLEAAATAEGARSIWLGDAEGWQSG